MQRYGVDESTAFRYLVRISQHSNTKLRDAPSTSSTASPPGAVRPGPLSPGRLQPPPGSVSTLARGKPPCHEPRRRRSRPGALGRADVSIGAHAIGYQTRTGRSEQGPGSNSRPRSLPRPAGSCPPTGQCPAEMSGSAGDRLQTGRPRPQEPAVIEACSAWSRATAPHRRASSASASSQRAPATSSATSVEQTRRLRRHGPGRLGGVQHHHRQAEHHRLHQRQPQRGPPVQVQVDPAARQRVVELGAGEVAGEAHSAHRPRRARRAAGRRRCRTRRSASVPKAGSRSVPVVRQRRTGSLTTNASRAWSPVVAVAGVGQAVLDRPSPGCRRVVPEQAVEVGDVDEPPDPGSASGCQESGTPPLGVLCSRKTAGISARAADAAAARQRPPPPAAARPRRPVVRRAAAGPSPPARTPAVPRRVDGVRC